MGDEAKLDLDRLVGRESAFADRPKTLVAGAAGVGMVLGVISDRMHVPRPHRRGRDGHGERRDGATRQPAGWQEEKKRTLVGIATGAAVDSIQGQFNELLSEVWHSFRSGFRGELGASEEPRTGEQGRTHYLRREEIGPIQDAEMHRHQGDRSPEQILHDAEVEDYSPREDFPAYAGAQGEGLLYGRTPGVQGPYEERDHSERRSGQ